MTRKHFEAIAYQISVNVTEARRQVALRPADGSLAAIYIVACDLAATFSGFNPNFSRTQFLKACGF